MKGKGEGMKLARIVLSIEAETTKRAEEISRDVADCLAGLGYADMATVEEIVADVPDDGETVEGKG